MSKPQDDMPLTDSVSGDIGPQKLDTNQSARSIMSEDQVMRWRSDAITQLCELTKRWTTYEDIPKSQQYECREIGKRLWSLGGMNAMRQAYYAAKGGNPAASTVQAYWNGIGDWRW